MDYYEYQSAKQRLESLTYAVRQAERLHRLAMANAAVRCERDANKALADAVPYAYSKLAGRF